MKTEIAISGRRKSVGKGDSSTDRDVLTAMLKQCRQKLGYCSVFVAVPAILAWQVQEARSEEPKKTEVSTDGREARRREQPDIRYSNPALLKRQSAFRLPHQKGSFSILAPFSGKDDCPGFAIPGGTYTAAAPYIDSGDTTGANDTVSSVCGSYCYYYLDAAGPDHIYAFTLSGLGANPQIKVTATSATFNPLIYVLENKRGCPGQGVPYGSWWLNFPSTGSTEIIDLKYAPLNVPLFLLVDSTRNDASGSGPYTLRLQDVTIAPAVAPSPNPLDDASFFARQQYLDFLNREPDAVGLGFWATNITKCSDPSQRPVPQTEAECIDRQQVTTSAAFFFSPEFQYTGYFVYRLYKGSLIQNGAGRFPTYQEFLRDVRQVASGIIQNNQLSAAAIEANKKTFAEEFTRRAEFRSLYDPLSNFDYVERLFQTTGVVNVGTQEKQALVNGLNNQTETRATVLQKIVDGVVVIAEGNHQFTTTYGRAFYDREFNRAFVLMEYFGYLRRDPDPAGFEHWIQKLNFYGNYIDAEMVRSFLNSPEYRERFLQP